MKNFEVKHTFSRNYKKSGKSYDRFFVVDGINYYYVWCTDKVIKSISKREHTDDTFEQSKEYPVPELPTEIQKFISQTYGITPQTTHP